MTIKDKILHLQLAGVVNFELNKNARVLYKKKDEWIDGRIIDKLDNGYYLVDIGDDVIYETKNVIPYLTESVLIALINSFLTSLKELGHELKIGYLKAVDLNEQKIEVILTINEQPVQAVFNSEMSALSYVIDLIYDLIMQQVAK